jgi:hypothetical protein
MKEATQITARIEHDFGDYVSFVAYGDVDEARKAVLAAANGLVHSAGRQASVTTGLTGRFGGAVITGVTATVRFQVAA